MVPAAFHPELHFVRLGLGSGLDGLADGLGDDWKVRVPHSKKRGPPGRRIAAGGCGLADDGGDPGPPVGRRGSERLFEDAQRVGQPLPELWRKDRAVRDFDKSLAQRDQRDGEVAAVDGRDVARLQGLQGLRVDPVEDMAAVLWQTPQRRQRGGASRGDVGPRRETQVERRQRRKELHPDIRGRGTVRGFLERRHLVVVRGQPIVGGTRVGLEIGPGAAREVTQKLAIFGPEPFLRAVGRTGDQPGDFRRDGPDGKQRQRSRQRGGRGRGKEDKEAGRENRRTGHLAPVAAPVVPAFRGDVGGGRPLQKVAARHQKPPEGPEDCVGGDDRVLRHEDDGQQPPSCMVLKVPPPVANDAPPPAPGKPCRNVRQQVAAGRGGHKQRPDKGPGRHGRPGHGRQRDQRGRDQAAPQVVGDLPPVECAKRVPRPPVAGRHRRKQPGQKLPVAPDPPVQTARVVRVAGRKILVEHDVRGKRDAAADALDQVVAGQRVVGEPAFDAPAETSGIVGALADEDALAEQVLVQVRDGAAVDVDGRVAGVEPREERRVAGLGSDLDAGLDKGATGDDAVPGGVQDRPVQRMRDRAKEPVNRPGRRDRVGVKRHDQRGPADSRHVAGPHVEVTRIAALEEAVERLDLAALALPPHPDAFGRVPAPLPVQQDEGAVFGVAVVQPRDPVNQRALDGRIARLGFGRGVAQIAQDREIQIRIGIGDPVPLEARENRRDFGGLPKDHRHHDRAPQVLGQSLSEIHLRQHARRHQAGDQPVGQRDADDRRREQEKHRRGG